jgi:hypothetical protein
MRHRKAARGQSSDRKENGAGGAIERKSRYDRTRKLASAAFRAARA